MCGELHPLDSSPPPDTAPHVPVLLRQVMCRFKHSTIHYFAGSKPGAFHAHYTYFISQHACRPLCYEATRNTVEID